MKTITPKDSQMSFKSGGIYIHIPYCRQKCLYCDFFSGGSAMADWKTLRSSLINELRERFDEVPDNVVSIYFGGGTPSIMPLPEMAELIKEIRSMIGEKLSTGAEVTIEINPEDVSEQSAAAWKTLGFNRVSLGIETFDDSRLKAIGRRHTGEAAITAFKILRRTFSNISADLIFGLPDQTEDMLKEDIRKLLALSPDHISVYSLMYEPGTVLTVLRDTGRLTPVDEETSLRMFGEISAMTKAEGFVRYEISNYSKPGFEAVHNTLYWTGAPYLGLGPAAHSYDGKATRRANRPDIRGYMKRFGETTKPPSGIDSAKHSSDSESPFYQEEKLSETELMEEYILTRIRLKQGFDLDEFRQRFGKNELSRVYNIAKELNERGEVTIKDNRIALTESGIMIEDRVILSLTE